MSKSNSAVRGVRLENLGRAHLVQAGELKGPCIPGEAGCGVEGRVEGWEWWLVSEGLTLLAVSRGI